MSQGTLYTFPTPRSTILEALIKTYKIDVTVKAGAESEEFATYFPLKKAPAFVGPKGFKLTECIAIAYYCMLDNLLLLLLCVVLFAYTRKVALLVHHNDKENNSIKHKLKHIYQNKSQAMLRCKIYLERTFVCFLFYFFFLIYNDEKQFFKILYSYPCLNVVHKMKSLPLLSMSFTLKKKKKKKTNYIESLFVDICCI